MNAVVAVIRNHSVCNVTEFPFVWYHQINLTL